MNASAITEDANTIVSIHQVHFIAPVDKDIPSNLTNVHVLVRCADISPKKPFMQSVSIAMESKIKYPKLLE